MPGPMEETTNKFFALVIFILLILNIVCVFYRPTIFINIINYIYIICILIGLLFSIFEKNKINISLSILFIVSSVSILLNEYDGVYNSNILFYIAFGLQNFISGYSLYTIYKS